MANIGGKGLEDGKYKDLDREHPDLNKYKRMQKSGLPQGAIENAMLRDGILPSSLYDSPLSSPDPVPTALLIQPKPKPTQSVAAPASSGGNKPPPGLSLMDEMKWRQNQKKSNNNSAAATAGIKLAERKKSVVQIDRTAVLRPAAATGAPPAPAPAVLFGVHNLKPVSLSSSSSANKTPEAKFTAPAYSNVLRPAAVNIAAQAARVAEKKLADMPAPPPKFEIDMSNGTVDIELPPPPPLPQQKQETVTLEDGTVVTREKDGGFMQVNPNGVIIHQFPDGATKQTNPDGTVIDVNADGTLTIQVNPDGTRFEANDKGEITTCFPDGTIVHDFGNGDKRQSNPDGTTITTYKDGRKLQVDANSQIEITVYPDGSIDQVDKATGKTLHCTPDGKVEQKS